jgi:hypothetical protein
MKKRGSLVDLVCDECKEPIRSVLPHGGDVNYYEHEGRVYCESCSKTDFRCR